MMKNVEDDLKRILKDNNPHFRSLKAYTINADGTSSPISGENIYIEIDEERGLLIPLAERSENEGVSIRSLPEEELDETSFQPNGEGSLVSSELKCSSIVIRNGGSNLIYVSPETKICQAIEIDPDFEEING